ncbi:phage scaffolding protein [Clostridium sp. BJN0013]|uniref:phage scaffolding protein n=1 Tax=Clostridium sp. BJN0013 TaxID=3236840 RepID=UPI0034C6538E
MFNIALDAKLTTVGARNPKVLKGLLDLGKLTLEDNGNFIGLREQVEAVKESDGYLFEEDNSQNNPGGNPNPGGTGNIGNPGSPQPGKELSLGERLAKQKTEAMKATEAQNKFFSIGGTNK